MTNMKYMKRAITGSDAARVSAHPLMAQGGSVKLAMGRERREGRPGFF